VRSDSAPSRDSALALDVGLRPKDEAEPPIRGGGIDGGPIAQLPPAPAARDHLVGRERAGDDVALILLGPAEPPVDFRCRSIVPVQVNLKSRLSFKYT